LFPETEEMLIEKVRQRTFLNDTKSADQHMRANAWEGIGKKFKYYVSSRDVRIVCPRLEWNRITDYPNKQCMQNI
jgi:hypothetical protein